ncbi:MAG: hypothetical protein JNL58_21440 [Planctomyces sp.]|nr:hypothetical protein [Planctomyces sp.]
MGSHQVSAIDSESQFEQRVDSVVAFPESFGVVFQNARAARLSGFPYLLLFEYGVGVVFVLGVFHSASNPAKWRGRSG